LFDARPVSDRRVRYFYLDGVPRNYDRLVHDPGVTGFSGSVGGSGPISPGFAVHHAGPKGPPDGEQRRGKVQEGSNVDVRLAGEVFGGRYVSALVEPMFLYSEKGELVQGRLNKGYARSAARESSWKWGATRTGLVWGARQRHPHQQRPEF